MTLVTSVLDRIARKCSVTTPSSWLTATGLQHVEIRDDFFEDTVSDILDRADMPEPIAATTSFTAGGGTTQADGSERFTLPTDFRRLAHEDNAVYDETQDRPALGVARSGSWENLTDVGATGSLTYYRLNGYEGNWTIDFYLSSGTIVVSYITNYWMADSAGAAGSNLTATDDVLLLPRTLLESGTVYRFRERRGLDWQTEWQKYEALLSRGENQRRGIRKIRYGGSDKTVHWTDLVPAHIPAS